MAAPPIADADSLAAVLAALRVIVLLSVPWSVPERIARSAFLGASERLASGPDAPSVLCAVLDEEAPPVRRWLASLGIPAFAGPAPLGAGSLLWLSAGRVVAFAIAGEALRSSEIGAKAGSLWPANA